ncbi:hypothetical protein BSKO_11069 [Bryopsis sp. KO-2023]|nr:hypothetical protein BSKO_11069 [Bryopsis sp. KO-2023]
MVISAVASCLTPKVIESQRWSPRARHCTTCPASALNKWYKTSRLTSQFLKRHLSCSPSPCRFLPPGATAANGSNSMDGRKDEEANVPLLEAQPPQDEKVIKDSLWNRLVWKNGFLLVTVASVLFAVVLVLVKEVASDIAGTQIIWIRAIIVTIGAPIMAKLLKSDVSLLGKKENMHLLAILGVVALGQVMTCWTAVNYVPMAEALSIVFSNSIVTAALAAILGLDKWSKITPVAVVLNVVGVVLVTRPAVIFGAYALPVDSQRILGWILSICSALCFTITFLVSKRLNNREGGVTMLYWQCLVMLVLTTVSLAVGIPYKPVFHVPASELVLSCAPAVLGILSWFLMYRSVQLTSATVVSVMMSLQLMWAFGFDLILFGVSFSGLSFLGCLCVFGASAIVSFTVVNRKKPATQVESGE